MNHFGFTLPEGIIGELATVAPYIIRAGVAVVDIPFGSFLELDQENGETSVGVRPYQDALNVDLPILGVALYDPENTTGYYPAGSTVSILEEGDVRLIIRSGETWERGKRASIVEVSGVMTVTSLTGLGGKNVGFFTTSGVTTVGGENSYIVSIKRFQ